MTGYDNGLAAVCGREDVVEPCSVSECLQAGRRGLYLCKITLGMNPL
jgi:hypothetical protein